MKQAKDEVIRLDQLRKAGEDPRLLKSESKRELIKQATNPSLIKAAESFLERSKNKPTTVKDYRNMLYNQVLPALGSDTPVKRLEWRNGGRQQGAAILIRPALRGSPAGPLKPTACDFLAAMLTCGGITPIWLHP